MLVTLRNSFQTIIDAIISTAFESKLPVAVWSCPKKNTWHIMLSLQATDHSKQSKHQEDKAGFIFSPFCSFLSDENKNDETCFIQNDLEIIINENDYHLTWHERVTSSEKVNLENKLLRNIKHGKNHFHTTRQSAEKFCQNEEVVEQKTFETIVDKAIKEIHNNQFEKVVLARSKSIKTNNISCASLLSSLKLIYPNTFVSLISTPLSGTWIGASPELLLEMENPYTAQTVALAGTREIKLNGTIDEWEDKEKVEHKIVDDYIQAAMKKMNVNHFKISEVTSYQVGKLLHLHRKMSWDIQETADEEAISKPLNYISVLHPTPAICGYPKNNAAKFIRENENFQREYYAGFLGPIDSTNRTSVYVNIRCMKIEIGHVELYAGAGITADSIATKEWHEVNAKLNAMTEVLISADINEQSNSLNKKVKNSNG